MSADSDPLLEPTRQTRRALLLGTLGGLGALLTGMLGQASPAAAAAGDPLRMGKTNKAGGTDTTLQTNSSGPALKAVQNGSGAALRGGSAGGHGGYFETAAPGKSGVYATTAASGGSAIRADGKQGIGIRASSDDLANYATGPRPIEALSDSGPNPAVGGYNTAEGGRGLFGEALGAGGTGVVGSAFHTTGTGIAGYAKPGFISGNGVYGESGSGHSDRGAVKGVNPNYGSEGYLGRTSNGVLGRALIAGAIGVVGENSYGGVAVRSNGSMQIANSYLDMDEIDNPAAPPVTLARLFVRFSGSGRTQLCVRFATGAVQVIATEP